MDFCEDLKIIDDVYVSNKKLWFDMVYKYSFYEERRKIQNEVSNFRKEIYDKYVLNPLEYINDDRVNNISKSIDKEIEKQNMLFIKPILTGNASIEMYKIYHKLCKQLCDYICDNIVYNYRKVQELWKFGINDISSIWLLQHCPGMSFFGKNKYHEKYEYRQNIVKYLEFSIKIKGLFDDMKFEKYDLSNRNRIKNIKNIKEINIKKLNIRNLKEEYKKDDYLKYCCDILNDNFRNFEKECKKYITI